MSKRHFTLDQSRKFKCDLFSFRKQIPQVDDTLSSHPKLLNSDAIRKYENFTFAIVPVKPEGAT